MPARISIYATARDPKTLEVLHERHGSRLVPLRLDVTKAEQVAEVAGESRRRHRQRRLGRWTLPLQPTYSASKAAQHSLTQGSRALLVAQGRDRAWRLRGAGRHRHDQGSPASVREKTAPESVAKEILDGIEAVDEDIFPDPFAVTFGEQFLSSPKSVERQMAAMVAVSA